MYNTKLREQIQRFYDEGRLADRSAVLNYIINTIGDDVTDEEIEYVIEWCNATPHWRRLVTEIVMGCDQ